jgi:hypothetical protein
MNSKRLVVLVAGFLAIFVVGCYHTVQGNSKIGLPSKDSIEGRYERPVEQVYAAARRVLEYNGTLRGDNTITKTLEARVNTRYVWVRVDEVEPNLSRVIVQVRTSGGRGDVDLAAELEKQIALQIAQSK